MTSRTFTRTLRIGTAATVLAAGSLLGLARPAEAASFTMDCKSRNGNVAWCQTGVNVKGLTVQNTYRNSTCRPAHDYGVNGQQIWVRNNCKGNFRVYHGNLNRDERQALGGGNRRGNRHNGELSVGEGVVLIGGGLVLGAILNNIFDDDHNNPPQVTYQPPRNNPPGRPGISRRERRQAVRMCQARLDEEARLAGGRGARILERDVSRGRGRTLTVTGRAKDQTHIRGRKRAYDFTCRTKQNQLIAFSSNKRHRVTPAPTFGWGNQGQYGYGYPHNSRPYPRYNGNWYNRPYQ